MFAIARLNTFDDRRLAASRAQLTEFERLHSSQPGYAGGLTLAFGDSTRMTINLWESERDARAALELLGPEVGRVLSPLMAAPSQLLGAGLVETDLTLTRPRRPRNGR